MADITRCRDCQMPIQFLRSAASGNIICLDKEPAEGGDIWIIDGVAHVKRDDLFEQFVPLDAPVYFAHQATCAAREEQRKEKKK